MSTQKKLEFLLVGNPNVGKSTLINAIAGSDLKIGNWSGTTFEKKTTVFSHPSSDQPLKLIDLPGLYSLTSEQAEEAHAAQVLLERSEAVIINVIDSTNLERNLYLTTELVELERAMIVVLNLTDELSLRGQQVMAKELEEILGVPVVKVSANRKEGVEELKNLLLKSGVPNLLVEHDLKEENSSSSQSQSRWQRLEAWLKEDPEQFFAVADRRYDWAQKNREKLLKPLEGSGVLGEAFSEKLDAWFLHPYFGPVLFLLSMFLVFRFTFIFSDPWIGWTEVGQEVLAGWARSLPLPPMLIDFLADGLIAGVGTMSAFIPVLFFLYFGLSFLENSGFLARAAFLIDRFMQASSLPGQAFIPMLLGFGCNVPAVYATKTLESEGDRLRVSLAIPFMSCSARLAVFSLFASIFFPDHPDFVIFALYLGGLLVGLGTVLSLRTVLPEGRSSAVEVPPYRLPSLGFLWKQSWHRTGSFVKRAGLPIVATVILVWLMLEFPTGDFETSYYAELSRKVEFFFASFGVSDWRLIGALIPGVIAKEVVVGTLGVSYLGAEGGEAMGLLVGLSSLLWGTWDAIVATFAGIPQLFYLPDPFGADPEAADGLPELIAKSVTAAGALAYMVFILLYTPCIATLAALRQEFGLRWASFSAIYQFVVAYLFALLTFWCYELFA